MKITPKPRTSQENISQEDRVALHLIKHGSISSLEAIDLYGITRLSSRIYKLRKRGWQLTSEPEKGKNRYGKTIVYSRYRLGGRA